MSGFVRQSLSVVWWNCIGYDVKKTSIWAQVVALVGCVTFGKLYNLSDRNFPNL